MSIYCTYTNTNSSRPGVLTISHRKQAEEALRLSEGRLQLALQAGRMGSFEWTSDGNHLSVSPMSAEVLGLLSEEPLTTTTSATGFELVHPDDRARQRAVRDAAEFLRQNEPRLPATQLAVRAIEVHDSFLGPVRGRSSATE